MIEESLTFSSPDYSPTSQIILYRCCGGITSGFLRSSMTTVSLQNPVTMHSECPVVYMYMYTTQCIVHVYQSYGSLPLVDILYCRVGWFS